MATYMSWKPDPYCKAVDALRKQRPHVFPYAPSPFCLREGIKEGFTGKGENNRNNFNLSIPTMVCHPIENEYREPFTSAELNRLTKKTTKGVTPSDQCKKIEVSCMAGFRQ